MNPELVSADAHFFADVAFCLRRFNTAETAALWLIMMMMMMMIMVLMVMMMVVVVQG